MQNRFSGGLRTKSRSASEKNSPETIAKTPPAGGARFFPESIRNFSRDENVSPPCRIRDEALVCGSFASGARGPAKRTANGRGKGTRSGKRQTRYFRVLPATLVPTAAISGHCANIARPTKAPVFSAREVNKRRLSITRSLSAIKAISRFFLQNWIRGGRRFLCVGEGIHTLILPFLKDDFL